MVAKNEGEKKKPTSKSTRTKKDPAAPKRPMTAYFFYANEQREHVRAANPKESFGRVHAIIGEQWRALGDKEKEPYAAKAAEDKKRYDRERQSYTASAATTKA